MAPSVFSKGTSSLNGVLGIYHRDKWEELRSSLYVLPCTAYLFSSIARFQRYTAGFKYGTPITLQPQFL